MKLNNITNWFYIPWYKYLFRRADNPQFCNKLKRIICRAKYHPCGPIYYNYNGYEPDDRCKNCGDYI